MNKNSRKLLLLILFFAVVVRLYRFDGPIADWQSWRQADTSAVSRNFVKFGYDFLRPRFDDLSNVPSGLDNPEGYRFVEFPLYNAFQAGLYQVFGILSLEAWGRAVSIFASLGAIVFLYLLIKKYAGERAGLLTAFFYAFLPYNIYFGRVILPDPTMVTAILGGIFFFDLWAEKNIKFQISNFKFYFPAIILTASALLLKPYAIFFTVPMIYLAWKRLGIRFLITWQLWLFAVLSLTPLILWRQWMTQYPEGIPANTWLLNGNSIRFRPAFFRWIFYERLIKLISGYIGFILLGFGAVAAIRLKNTGFFVSFALGSLLYMTVFATGNVQHDYYQILIMPTVAIFLGLGGNYLLEIFSERKRVHFGSILLVAITVIAFYFSWKQVKDYFNINNPVIIEAGKVVDKNTPKDAKVIALYNGDTAFLYQTNRRGWASFQNPLPEMIAKGADYLIQTNPTSQDIALYQAEYEIIASSSSYVLVKLR